MCLKFRMFGGEGQSRQRHEMGMKEHPIGAYS